MSPGLISGLVIVLVGLVGCDQGDDALRARIHLLKEQLAQKNQEISRLSREKNGCESELVAVTKKLVRTKVERDQLKQVLAAKKRAGRH